MGKEATIRDFTDLAQAGLAEKTRRSELKNEEKEANFRRLILGNRLSDTFYRSASLESGDKYRYHSVQVLMREYHIKTTIDLSNVHCRSTSDEFAKVFIKKLAIALSRPAPYIIQCQSGKKNTGFACMMLEAFSGTSYNNIVADYLISYHNDNGLNWHDNHEELNALRENIVDKKIRELSNEHSASIYDYDLQQIATNYFLKYGFTEADMTMLKEVLLK